MKTKLPTIQEVLQIEVTAYRNGYKADAKALTGSPPMGTGMTEWEAMYDLLCKILWEWPTWVNYVLPMLTKEHVKTMFPDGV